MGSTREALRLRLAGITRTYPLLASFALWGLIPAAIRSSSGSSSAALLQKAAAAQLAKLVLPGPRASTQPASAEAAHLEAPNSAAAQPRGLLELPILPRALF